MVIETKEKTLRKRGNVELTAVFSEETFFHGRGFDARNEVVRKLVEFRLSGPTGLVKMKPEHFDLRRLNAHGEGFFQVNGKSFKPLTELPKGSTTRWERV